VAGKFEALQQVLKRLPGLGHRSAERLALHLLVEKRERSEELLTSLAAALESVVACKRCGNLSEGDLCEICRDGSRQRSVLCIVESVSDLRAMERAGAYRGLYHVLQGKLSPIHGVGPEHLNLEGLAGRVRDEEIEEVILALPNDIEGESTCHYIREEVLAGIEVKSSRIGFGLPSGGGIPFVDSTTLRSALEGRRATDG
jgi:recombination protein RecR